MAEAVGHGALFGGCVGLIPGMIVGGVVAADEGAVGFLVAALGTIVICGALGALAVAMFFLIPRVASYLRRGSHSDGGA